MQVSIILPVLNEADCLQAALERLQPFRKIGHELIVVDGGSSDGSDAIAKSFSDHALTSACGRAQQMNQGAAAAKGDVLWFLHADTIPPDCAIGAIQTSISTGHLWGRFNVRLSGSHWLLRIVEWVMNKRSCLTGVATGDQGLYIRRDVFERVGGFPKIAIMEDIALSKCLRRHQAPDCLKSILVASSRRWEEQGILRTIFFMWRLRLAYFLGADPGRLAERYYPK